MGFIPSRFQPPVPFVGRRYRAPRTLTRQRRLAEIPGQFVIQLLLVAFDDHEKVSALLTNLLGDLGMRQSGIQRHHTAAQIASFKQERHGVAFMLFLGDTGLGKHASGVMLDQTDQDRGLSMCPRTTNMLAINRISDERGRG